MKYDKEMQVELYKKLAYKSMYEAGVELGLDKYYRNRQAIINAVSAIYRKINNNPDDYPEVSDELRGLIRQAIQTRRVDKNRVPKADVEEETDLKSLVTSMRDRTAGLIDKKLKKLENSPKKLEKVSLKELTTVFGISFDKSQIVQGQATEHVAHYAKIAKDMDPDDALDLILKQREQSVSRKEHNNA